MTNYRRLIAVNVGILILILVIVEGLSSFAWFVYETLNVQVIPARRHTQYDPDIGWVNQQGVDIQDMYGPGVYLKTNAQGFRNSENVNSAVPAGKTRIICSGDSFTLGYGVDNDHTWCHLLATLNPRLETVNMGQGGYGVDQAYLWYKRDGTKIEHQVQILAFVTDDFRRMQTDSFTGYAKPLLAVERGSLVVKNVPVPARSYSFPRLAQNIENLRDLRSITILNKVSEKLHFGSPKSGQPAGNQKNDQTREVLHQIFVDLKRINQQHSSTLVLVFLPIPDEILSQDSAHGPEEWTEFLNNESRSLQVPFINVFDAFSSLPARELVKLKGLPAFKHYSNAGNQFVAEVITEGMMHDPAIRDVLLAHNAEPAAQPQK